MLQRVARPSRGGATILRQARSVATLPGSRPGFAAADRGVRPCSLVLAAAQLAGDMTVPGVHKCHRLLRVPPARCSPVRESAGSQHTTNQLRGARGCPCPGAGLWEQAKAGCRSAADMQRAEARKAEANVRRRAWAAPRGAATMSPSLTRLGFLRERAGRHRRLKTCGHFQGTKARGRRPLSLRAAAGPSFPAGTPTQPDRAGRSRSCRSRRCGRPAVSPPAWWRPP
jgi:hypothetical protein